MKKYLSLLLIVTIVLSGCIVSSADDYAFIEPELGNDSYFYDNVAWLSEKGIIDDEFYSKYKPEDRITCSEFLNMLAAVAETDLSKYNTIRIVDENLQYSQAIQWAFETGIIHDTELDCFSPNDYLNRESMAVYVERYGNSVAGFEFPQIRNDIQFKDSAYISECAEDAVAVFYHGIMLAKRML